jgi:hypothetical protein
MNNVCYFINFDYNLTMIEFHTKNVIYRFLNFKNSRIRS